MSHWKLLFLSYLTRRLLPNYPLTWDEIDWFYDEEFRRVLTRFGERYGFNAHRRFALQQLLRLVDGVPGDTAECGVYKGLGSFIILQANQRSCYKRMHHIFDSFEGLSAPSSSDGKHWRQFDLGFDMQRVKDNLAEFAQVSYYKGWIPERFNEVADREFAFVHVDVDLYQPTADSVSFFYERLNKGGVLLCDDYGFLTCPGATRAMDEFLEDKVEKMIFLPGGGGFFIKGTRTAMKKA
ncbi:MAG: TylF/MycF family methyltransferase [Nitrospira sp.]|nr:TylF/MycF family methyltransferase [Nitrospira sp.]